MVCEFTQAGQVWLFVWVGVSTILVHDRYPYRGNRRAGNDYGNHFVVVPWFVQLLVETLSRKQGKNSLKYKIFGAPWCGNCNATKTQLDVLGIQYEYINIDEQPELAKEHIIRSLPTLISESGQRAIGLLKILELVKTNEHLSSN